MRRFVVLLLVFGSLAAPAQAEHLPEYALPAANSQAVDLLAESGHDIVFRIDPEWFGEGFVPHSMLVRLDCTCGTILRTATADGATWRAFLPVDTKDLVVGTWSVSVQATAESGQTVTRPTGEAQQARTLVVTATEDTAAPTLVVQGLQDGQVRLGAGQSLQMSVSDALLRDVRYKIAGMPQSFSLPFPYRLSVSSFQPGPQDVSIQALDRTNRSTWSNFTVYADQSPPEATLLLPDVLYQGIPNVLRLRVKEHSSFEVLAEIDGKLASLRAPGGSATQDVQLELTPERVGTYPLSVRIIDDLQNEVTLTQSIPVVQVTADAYLLDVQQVSTAIGGEPVKVRIRAQQVDGVTAIPFTLHFLGQSVGQIVLPQTGVFDQVVEMTLPAGTHEALMSMRAPEAVLEQDTANQARQAAIEVFLARVTYGTALFHIRASALGLPTVAVDSTGQTYPLALRTHEGPSVYGFQVDGTDLHWDPSSNSTQVPLDRPEELHGDNSIPGAPLVLLLAALAFLARRRHG